MDGLSHVNFVNSFSLSISIELKAPFFYLFFFLQVVKVYVSVFGDERGREVAIAGLKAKAKYVRSELGRRMKLRLTPEIRFIEDDSLERGSRVCFIFMQSWIFLHSTIDFFYLFLSFCFLMIYSGGLLTAGAHFLTFLSINE